MIDLELQFRLIFLAIFLSSISVSAYHRRKARQSGETIPRRKEGMLALFLRAAMALPLLAAILAYIFAPHWLEWSTISLPRWLRLAGAGTGILCLPLIWWVFTSIGENISETVLTKREHQLVSHGPYRWVRHPLYAVTLFQLLSLSVLAGSWLLILFWSLGVIVFRLVVIPKEERHLIEAFGRRYVDYQERTGALVPRVF